MDARERLREWIAAKDAERGRPLTDSEKLENLRRWLAEEDSNAKARDEQAQADPACLEGR